MKPAMIKKKIIASHPLLAAYLAPLKPIPRLQASALRVDEAVAQIVVGQMLSRKAASTIIARATALALSKNKPGMAQLTLMDLRHSGISERKAQTIVTFAKYYKKNTLEVEGWRNLTAQDLYVAVDEHKGLSVWSASMLGIFYFAMEDIFPEKDGTLIRVQRLLQARDIYINSMRVIPYRTYLALYLWRLIDESVLEAEIG